MMRKLIVRLLLTLLMSTLLAACTSGGKVYRIAVSQCSQGPWRQKLNREMLAAQHLYEHDVEVSIVDAFDDTDLQIRQIDSLAATDLDLLVVAPNEAAPIAEAIARASQRGLPVICFDRKAQTEDYTAFIGGDNVEAGRTVGEYAAQLQRGGAGCTVLEVTATMSTSPAQERHRGFEQAMKSHPELEYVCINSEWSTDEVYKVVKERLETGLLPDIIFCHSDFMAYGAYQAVEEAGLRDEVKILGIDGMPYEGIDYIQKGYMDGSYIYPTHGEKIVRLALDILTGQPYERDNFLPSMMVTPQNADMVAMNSRELLQQGEDLITIQDKLEQYLGLYNTQHRLLVVSLVVILLLIVAVALTWRAFIQMRKALHERQSMNEEQTLFYTNPNSRKLRQVFEAPVEEQPAVRSQDAIFAEKLNEAIRQNMANPQLKMDDLGDTVGLSRVQLYRKVKAITGLTPVELLRQMRLQQGYLLLTTTDKTVQEVAYEVGFGTPGYFSSCFKKQYGKYPTDLRAESTNPT